MNNLNGYSDSTQCGIKISFGFFFFWSYNIICYFRFVCLCSHSVVIFFTVVQILFGHVVVVILPFNFQCLTTVPIVSLICVTEVPAAMVCVASGVKVSLEGDKLTLLISWILVLLLLPNYLSLPGLVEV